MTADGKTLGVIGEVQARVLDNFNLDAHPVAIFEISMDALLSAIGGVSLTYQSSSPYPESYRDLAIVVDEDVTVSRIRQIIERHALVVRSAPFDIYSGEGVEEGRKSVAFRVVFQSDRGTLTSDQVDPLPERHTAPAKPKSERGASRLIALIQMSQGYFDTWTSPTTIPLNSRTFAGP